MNIKNLLVLGILTIILLTGCGDKSDDISESIVDTKEEIQQLPIFHLKTTMGKPVTIEVTKDGWIFKEYPNKIVLLNFFATWCPPCKAEIPHLNNLSEKYKDDFVTISILVEKDKSNKEISKFIKQYNIQYPITNSPANFDLANAVGGVSTIPAMFMFNKKGLVIKDYIGAVQEEILDSDIKNALGK